ncbi:MAG: hypothetical protein NPIRA05_16850 [Nitrospirales bacterium]|nr:MAG: hypothetical protein NPIRA05_16850 [Nitrospirales bacterium]
MRGKQDVTSWVHVIRVLRVKPHRQPSDDYYSGSKYVPKKKIQEIPRSTTFEAAEVIAVDLNICLYDVCVCVV